MPIDFAKIEATAPGLVTLAKTAGVSLAKHQVSEKEGAAVYLVLDHSGSMQRFYRDGSVQRLAEQALALSLHLDDDGVVPTIFFGSRASRAFDVRLDDYEGVVERLHQAQRWGSTNMASAIEAVIEHYRASTPVHPGLVVFQTDGNPDSRREAQQALIRASHLPLFWAFVGFGERVEFLMKLDELRGRKVDNASAFHATDPLATSDEDLFDGILHEFPTWLADARKNAIVW